MAQVGPVAEIDIVMAAAWPPTVVEEHDGWQLRYTAGITRRANSVLAIGTPVDLPGAVERAEAFYRRRDAEPVFLVSDASTPEEVQAFLADAGYRGSATTWMLTAPVTAVTAALPGDDRWQIEVSSRPTDDWFGVYWEVESPRHSREDAHILRTQLMAPDAWCRFVSVRDEDQVVAVGEVVVSDGWGCVQCLATASASRRQGAGSAALRALASEGDGAEAPRVFAAVIADNRASLGLCQRAGFRPSHQYRYLVPVRS